MVSCWCDYATWNCRSRSSLVKVMLLTCLMPSHYLNHVVNWTLSTNSSDVLFKIEMHFKMLSANWLPFGSGLNMSKGSARGYELRYANNESLEVKTYIKPSVNRLGPVQNGQNFVGNIFKWISLNENVRFSKNLNWDVFRRTQSMTCQHWFKWFLDDIRQ